MIPRELLLNVMSFWDKFNLSPSVSLDMMNISQAKKAQDLATETTYRTFLHKYTTLPTDMNVAWAKKVYGLQSDVSLMDL